MKVKLILFTIFITLILSSRNVFAEDNTVNIKEWNFKKLLNICSNEDEHVTVSKFFKVANNSKYGFCMEANEAFLPKGSIYTLEDIDNDRIFNIVKAYDQIGLNDDNYYIAAQILIWEQTNGVTYTFSNNDYSKYIENLEKKIKENTTTVCKEQDYDVKYGEEYTINIDLSKYSYETTGVQITEINDTNFKVLVSNPTYTNDEPKIVLTPIKKETDQDYVIVSEGSQNIYHFDGEYSDKLMLNLFATMPDTIDIEYRKYDEFFNPIQGAEFTLYEIDDTENDYITFIQINENIDIYEALINKTYVEGLSIKLSERYARYLDEYIFNSNEIGSFEYEVFENDTCIRHGVSYIVDDIYLSNGTYNNINVKLYKQNYSTDNEISTIDDVKTNTMYYLCESEPAKGYTYKNNPCALVDTYVMQEEPYNFENIQRTYTLRLMKQSPQKILLDGAVFNISYYEDEKLNSFDYTTGMLTFIRKNNYKYLIYRKDGDVNANVVEFKDNFISINTMKEGKYYYYQSNSNEVDESKLTNKYVELVKGGFNIYDLPYSSTLRIEEIKAPNGFIITDPVQYVNPDIRYSEITFKNYRVNYSDIIPGKRMRIPKTCIDELYCS